MSLRLIPYRVLRKLGMTPVCKRETQDDFDWGVYPSHYQSELAEIQKSHTLKLSSRDYVFSNGNLILERNILPLHPNHRLLYETILQLQPKSVMEIGCGGGDHLYNLMILLPQIELHGCDLSPEQLSALRRRSPDLKADIRVWDISLPHSALLPVVDLCYTQAVIMHIKTGNGHLLALANLFKIATKHVVLMENWMSHDFLSDIQMLYDKKMIPWLDLFCYYRSSPELNNSPHLMVISAHRLDYEPLTDYRLLVGPLLNVK